MSTATHDVARSLVVEGTVPKTEQMTFRLSESLLIRLKRFTAKWSQEVGHPMTRSAAIAKLLDRALAAEGFPRDEDEDDAR